MRVRSLSYKFSLSDEDRTAIRAALGEWGKPHEVVESFEGAALYAQFERWEQFVDADWSTWDTSEYDHELECRVWIQVAIEHSSPVTRADLELAVQPLDVRFCARMLPSTRRRHLKQAPLSSQPYFWQSNTLHPDEAAGTC